MSVSLRALMRLAAMALLSLLMVACVSTPPPVSESSVVKEKPAPSPSHYVVQRGDTLYAIAFRFGLDYRGLAAANGIRSPYTIHPGNKLRLTDIVPKSSVAMRVPTPAAPQPKVDDKPATPVASGGRGWQWPVSGKVISQFDKASVGPKGIALAGNTGDPVRAARGGRVVYTGNSLVGYGQLVIIKHDDIYLSAYAHNSKLLVKEGQQVNAGQEIAEMGSSGTDRTQLHFEVRRNGDPIDPLQVLPAR